MIDLTGQKIGRLTVVSRAANDKSGNGRWYCRCDCDGIVREKPYYYSVLTRKDGIRSCGCWARELNSRRKRKPEGYAVITGLIGRYRNRAAKLGLPCTLTREQFQEFFESPCLFCGRSGVNIAKSHYDQLPYNGIDRLDNDQGYSFENCATCCEHCNEAKMDRTLRDFLLWIRLVYENTKDYNLD